MENHEHRKVIYFPHKKQYKDVEYEEVRSYADIIIKDGKEYPCTVRRFEPIKQKEKERT